MHRPENTKPYDKLYALISVDKNGNEGIVMMNMPMAGPQVAVTGDQEILDHYVKVASTMETRMQVHNAGLKIVIGEFVRTETKELQ